MARPLRVDVRGGWYHVSARGIERRRIYWGPNYCRHFLEYLHLNPVRTKAMGLGKREAAAERRGYAEPSDQEVAGRLEKLRKFQWSSYPAYAGYETKPKWLRTETILGRAGGHDRYREGVQAHLTGGANPKAFESLRGRVLQTRGHISLFALINLCKRGVTSRFSP